jgi:hypothetical protein
MTDGTPQELGRIPKLVIGLISLLIAAGVLRYTVAPEALGRVWRQLLERPTGPMSFRFILQPAMATIVAIRDGIKDARTDRSPYFWTVVRSPGERAGRLREGLTATARIILLGLTMDLIYQLLEFKTFYPNQAVVVALLLAVVPYLLIRGPVTRIIRRRRSDGTGKAR